VTDPKHMAQWWGPHGFTNPVCEMDARVGGAILIHMRAPDGTVHPMTGTFREIVEGERIVFTAVAEDHAGNPLLEALTTVIFEEQGGKTKLTVQASAVGLAPVAPQMLAGMEAAGRKPWSVSRRLWQAYVDSCIRMALDAERKFDPTPIHMQCWVKSLRPAVQGGTQ